MIGTPAAAELAPTPMILWTFSPVERREQLDVSQVVGLAGRRRIVEQLALQLMYDVALPDAERNGAFRRESHVTRGPCCANTTIDVAPMTNARTSINVAWLVFTASSSLPIRLRRTLSLGLGEVKRSKQSTNRRKREEFLVPFLAATARGYGVVSPSSMIVPSREVKSKYAYGVLASPSTSVPPLPVR